MPNKEKDRCLCQFHALRLGDEGLIYRVDGTNDYYTFKDPKNVPEGASLVFHQSFKALRREAGWIVKNGKINDQYADMDTWTDRGLRIVCMSGELERVPEMGEWECLTGSVYRWD